MSLTVKSGEKEISILRTMSLVENYKIIDAKIVDLLLVKTVLFLKVLNSYLISVRLLFSL